MNSVVRASIDIAAPPERVWEVVMNPRRLKDWVTIHRRLGRVSDEPLRRGSTLEQTLSLRGVRFHVHWTVSAVNEPHSAVWEGDGPARSHARTHYELRPAGDGATRFDYVNEFHLPGGPLGVAAGRVAVNGVSEREAARSLRRLKAVVERG